MTHPPGSSVDVEVGDAGRVSGGGVDGRLHDKMLHVTAPSPRRGGLLACLAAVVLVVGACSGDSGDRESASTTSFPYLVDPVEPGAGFIELDGNRYPFEGVICASGPVASDPEGSTRRFGVYANFEVDGTLAAVSLTRYRNQESGLIETVPTLTDTALIRMQGDGEVRGLSATRFQIEGEKNWQDRNDPQATEPLITRDGDRYEAEGQFAAVNPPSPATTEAGGESGSAEAVEDPPVPGRVVARCPDPSTTTTAADQANPDAEAPGAPAPVPPTSGAAPPDDGGATVPEPGTEPES